MNKSKVRFLQIRQDAIRQKCCQNMKSASAHIHMRRDTLYTGVWILCDSPSPYQLHTYFIDDPFLNQKTFEFCIHVNINVRKNEFL